MCAKKSVKQLTNVRVLKKKLLELARSVDAYEELKLTLMLDGWDLNDEQVKEAVYDWLVMTLSSYTNRSYFVRILGLDEGPTTEQVAKRCGVMKGLWKDVIGVKDKEAARVGMLLVVDTMSFGWDAADMDDEELRDKKLEEVGKLATWLGKMAW